jgi:membrane protease YdiL (CAAX protease family)
MELAHDILAILMTRPLAAAGASGTTEPDLLERWPAAGTLLFLFGLIADAVLTLRYLQQRRTGTVLRVGARPWGLRELFVAGGVATGAFLTVAVVGSILHLRLPVLLTVLGLTELTLLGVFALCLRLERIKARDAFGLTDAPVMRAVVMGMVFFLAVQPPLMALASLRDAIYQAFHLKMTSQDIVQMLMASRSAYMTMVIIAFALVVAPLCEETFFRGLAYPAFKQRWGAPVAMAAASALFALIHFHVPSLPLLFLLGLGLTFSYEYTGNLLTPITMHALFNLLNLAVLLAYRALP